MDIMCNDIQSLQLQHTPSINTQVPKGVPMDPTFVFRAFYYFRLRFFDRYFL